MSAHGGLALAVGGICTLLAAAAHECCVLTLFARFAFFLGAREYTLGVPSGSKQSRSSNCKIVPGLDGSQRRFASRDSSCAATFPFSHEIFL